MPLHSLIIVNLNNENLLFSKYFNKEINEKLDSKIDGFERLLFCTSKRYWDKAQIKKNCNIGIVCVVMEIFGDLLIFANGWDNSDEVICKFEMRIIMKNYFDYLF